MDESGIKKEINGGESEIFPLDGNLGGRSYGSVKNKAKDAMKAKYMARIMPYFTVAGLTVSLIKIGRAHV